VLRESVGNLFEALPRPQNPGRPHQKKGFLPQGKELFKFQESRKSVRYLSFEKWYITLFIRYLSLKDGTLHFL
jgi:hypothetical protein